VTGYLTLVKSVFIADLYGSTEGDRGRQGTVLCLLFISENLLILHSLTTSYYNGNSLRIRLLSQYGFAGNDSAGMRKNGGKNKFALHIPGFRQSI